MKVSLLLICLCLAIAVKPPTPACQSYPATNTLPISFAETQRWDLEYLFDGYNLNYKIEGVNYTTISEKYLRNQKTFDHNMNFTNSKIFGNSRFLAIETNSSETVLYIGMNDEHSGVTIDKTVVVQKISATRCFDVEQIHFNSTSYAIIDCANFRNNALVTNQFFYVDLLTFEVHQTTHMNDVFVRYNELRNRFIHVEHDPFNNFYHLYRVIRSEDVDFAHRNNTYIEIFDITQRMQPNLIEIIDHTIFGHGTLNIVDFKFYEGLIYILDFNRALYEIRFTNNQKINIRSKFNVQNDVQRFSVNRLGVNDDLTVVLTNGHHVYEYNWIIPNTPILKYKYALMPNSLIEHVFNNQHFVFISAWSTIRGVTKDTTYRKLWVFSHMSNSYLDAFAAFELPQTGHFHMIFTPYSSHLVVFGNYKSINYIFSLPFLIINPTRQTDIGTQLVVTLTATSTEDTQTNKVVCSQNVTYIVIDSNNMSIFGRGFQGRQKYVVDSPDERQFYIGEYFFGPNIAYNLTFNTTVKPDYQIEKRFRSRVVWKGMPQNITLVDMFQFVDGGSPQSIYGLVQDANQFVHLIQCTSNKQQITVTCQTLLDVELKRGPIKSITRVDGEDIDHRMAIVFEQDPHEIVVFKMTKNSLTYIGFIKYNSVFDNQVSSMSISKNLIFVVSEIGKRMDVYRLQDLGHTHPDPINRITSQMMKFMGIPYFAPMECQTSIYHEDVVFIKSKTGIIVVQIDEIGLVNVLYSIPVQTSKYDMQISDDNILVFTEQEAILYQLQVPLTNRHPPYLLQTLKGNYTLGKYQHLIADQLFYIVQSYEITVLHTDMPSNSVYYDLIEANAVVKDIDAVKFQDRQFLIVLDLTGLSCWQLFYTPKVTMKWSDEQPDFEVTLTGSNNQSSSVGTSVKFAVLNLGEAKIIPTQKFNNTQLNDIILFPDPSQNIQHPRKNISFSDNGWFNGSVLHYRAQCKSCGGDIHFHNHVYDEGDIIAAPYIYEVQSSLTGVYIQQYESVMKTHINNSIHFQAMLPTNMPGQPCTKIAVPSHQLFSVSVCEAGQYMNLYITSYVTQKPFTFGPTKSGAKQANKVKFEHGVMMLVDVEDNIFSRQGGIYLYALHLNPTIDQQFALLDVIQTQDLQIGQFKGLAYISSADLKHTGNDRYHLIITEAFSGGVFVFTFYLNRGRHEIIYQSQVYINIHKLFDETILIPNPLRIASVIVLRQAFSNNQYTYGLLATVANWHHIHFNVTIEGERVTSSKVIRLYERYPQYLVNYVKIKQPPFGFFSVPYLNRTTNHQVVVVYDLKDHQDNLTEIQASKDIPITPLLGAHYVNNSDEVSFDFNETNRQNYTGQSRYDNLLFVDVDSHNLTSLKVNRNLTVFYDKNPGNQTMKITAMNVYTHLQFNMDIKFQPESPPDPPTPDPDVTTVEIIWIIIMVVGFIIIVGLVLICAYQIKKQRLQRLQGNENKQSLISRESLPLNINRTTFNSEAPVPIDARVSQTSEIQTQTENLP